MDMTLCVNDVCLRKETCLRWVLRDKASKHQSYFSPEHPCNYYILVENAVQK